MIYYHRLTSCQYIKVVKVKSAFTSCCFCSTPSLYFYEFFDLIDLIHY